MNESKGKQILFVIALLCANIAVMGDNAIYPIIANIYGTFPDQMGWVNYIVSGPLFIIFLVSLAASKLFKYFSKKSIMVIGGVLFAVSSILGVAVENVIYIAAMRTVYGVSIALINVSAMALIAEVYEDEDKRGWMTGIFNAAMSVFGTIASLCAGVLAVDRWQNAYRYYYVAIPMVILFALFLPNMKERQAADASHASGESHAKEPYSAQFWTMIITVSLITLCFYLITNFSSTYIAEHNLGNTTSAGVASACCTLGSMVFCIAFGGIYSRMQKNLPILSCIMIVFSYVILYFTANLMLTYIAIFLVGGAYGMALSFAYAHGAALAPTRVDDAIGMATASYAIAGFLSTYIASGLMSVMGTDMITPVFIVPMILVIVIGIAYFFVSEKQ